MYRKARPRRPVRQLDAGRRSDRVGLASLVAMVFWVLSESSTASVRDPLAVPLENANLNPLLLSHALPGVAPVVPLGPGQSSFSLRTHWVSNFADSGNDTAVAVLDGETFIGSLRFARGIGAFEWGIELPYVRHSGGFLDPIIVDWHDFFGLPQGGREMVRDDQLRYEITARDTAVLLDRPVRALGDVRLHVARPVVTKVGATSWRIEVKAPTGDLDRLTGTGGVDATVSLHHERTLNERWSIGAWAGASWLSRPDDRAELARQGILGGGIVARMKLTGSVVLKAQWAGHSAAYDSDLPVLRRAPGILSFGGSIRLGARDVLDIAVLENWPNGEASPDFSFGLAWRRFSP